MKSIIDLHTHALASGHAYSTVKENIEYAKINGLKYYGLSDHGVNMPGGPHLFYFQNLKVLPKEIDGVRILKGMEANIIDYDGNIDVTFDKYLNKLDYEEVVKKAKEKNILLEVNNSSINPDSFRPNARENYKELLTLCKEHNVRIILGSDAHICYQVGILDDAERLIEEFDFPKELVINYHEDQIIEFFELNK